MTKLFSRTIKTTAFIILFLTIGCKKQDDEIPMYWRINEITNSEFIKVNIVDQGYPAHININVAPDGGELILICSNLSNEFHQPCFYLMWDSDIPEDTHAPYEKLSNDWCEVSVSHNLLKFKFRNRLPDVDIKEVILDASTAYGHTKIEIKGIP